MQPNFLFRSGREGTRSQQILHLLDASEQNVSRKEPSHTFSAGRRRQTTLVGPEFLEVIDLTDGRIWVYVNVLDRARVVEMNCWGVLSEEGRLVAAGIEADGDNSAGLFVLIVARDRLV